MVGGKTLEVRNGIISDETGHIAFAFWRDLATYPFVLGGAVQISNGKIGRTTAGEPKITSSNSTKIEVTILAISIFYFTVTK